MNKDLYGKQFNIPNEMIENLKKFSNEESVAHIINNPTISYSNLKKFKNRMENGEKENLGGDSFLGWINQTLNSQRDSIHRKKENRANTGMQNQFIKPHEKNRSINTLNRSTKGHNKENSDIKITEALKRINQIMSKII